MVNKTIQTAIASRACDEYLGAPIGQVDLRNAPAAVAAIREDAKLLRLQEFVEKIQVAAAAPPLPRIIKIMKSFRKSDNPEQREPQQRK